MKCCSNCGTDCNDDQMSFCTECGTPLADLPTVSDPKARTVRMGNEYETRRMLMTDNEPILDEMELEFMKMVSSFDELSSEQIAMSRGLNLQRVRYHMDRLVEIDLLDGRWNADGTLSYGLTHEGRGYLVRKNLL